MALDRFRARVGGLLRANHNADKELGLAHIVKMRIDTSNHPLIKLRPYQTPTHKRPLVEKVVQDVLEEGMIERSKSPWSFPIVVVDKKDGRHRFCVDFRKLNFITKPLAVPLPLINILALLWKAKYFSIIDLRSGYWQVGLEANRKKAAFLCDLGLFQFKVMLFGLANASGIFQLMSVVLGGGGGFENFTMAYLDLTLEQHFDHLKQILGQLREHRLKLKLKLSKCLFLRWEDHVSEIYNKWKRD